MTINELIKALKEGPNDKLKARTIHFYITEGLLPSPGQGGSTEYTEEHFWRFKAIRKLQKSHLKLSGIRETLKVMDLEEVKEFVSEESDDRLVPDMEDVFSRILKPESRKMKSEIDTKFEAGHGKFQSKNYSLLDMFNGSRQCEPENSKSEGRVIKKNKNKSKFDHESWQRISVADGIELNVRADTLKGRESHFEQLVIELRKKFKKG